MAAGLGFKDFTTGEVLTAADVDGYLMQGIWVFASTAARDAAVTAPAEGNFAFTKDTNGLWYYDGAAWVASGATGDIEGVTAGIGISGGGTSGTVTITNSMATAIDAKGDLVAGTGADAFSKLTVGANDTVLTADSTTATGLKWATPASGGATYVGCLAYRTTSLTVSYNTWTVVDLDDELNDSDGFHSTSTNTSRITIPTGKGGRYLINSQLLWDQKTSGSQQMRVRKNATSTLMGVIEGNTGYITTNMSQIASLSAGDYIQLEAYSDSSGGNTVVPYETQTLFLQVLYLGA